MSSRAKRSGAERSHTWHDVMNEISPLACGSVEMTKLSNPSSPPLKLRGE